MTKRILFILGALMTFNSCSNPTAVIDQQKKEYRSRYQNNYYEYQSGHRKMWAAWSGQENKRPLIFVHGSPGSYDAWSEFLLNPELQSQYHIISPDRPGYGHSGQGEVELSVEKQAADIWAVLQYNKSGLPAILVGHSYGGPVVARMAMDHPEKTAGVVFVAGSLDPALEDYKWYQNFAVWKITRWMVPTDLVVCNDEIMALKTQLEQMIPLYSKITAPSVIIQGDVDDLVDPRNLDFLQKHLTASRVLSAQMTPGMNHFVPWKNQDLIYQGIRQVHDAIEKKN